MLASVGSIGVHSNRPNTAVAVADASNAMLFSLLSMAAELASDMREILWHLRWMLNEGLLLLPEMMQVAVMNILVPLLIEVAKPAASTPVTPVLRDMACKLVSAMPTSAAAAAFRTAVVALPAASKQRLQLALKEQAAAAAAAAALPVAAGAASGGRVAAAVGSAGGGLAPPVEARKPAIQLKMNFAMPTASSRQ